VVSNNVFNKSYIARSLGASRYFVKNVVVRKTHVDKSEENF
jgi:hypothetical protein